MAFLTKGLRIDFTDERGETFRESFQYDGGIVDFVKYLHSQGTRDPLHKKVVYLDDTGDTGEVEVAMQWNTSYQETLLSTSTSDRKSTRLNSSHEWISYAVFCLKKKIE